MSAGKKDPSQFMTTAASHGHMTVIQALGKSLGEARFILAPAAKKFVKLGATHLKQLEVRVPIYGRKLRTACIIINKWRERDLPLQWYF